MATSSYSHPPDTVSGVTTTWLPMTTAWPAISQCGYIYSPLGKDNAVAYNPSIVGTNLLMRCLPPEVTSWLEQTRFTPYFTVTSIGPMVCPEDYYIITQISLDTSSTLVRCCPSWVLSNHPCFLIADLLRTGCIHTLVSSTRITLSVGHQRERTKLDSMRVLLEVGTMLGQTHRLETRPIHSH